MVGPKEAVFGVCCPEVGYPGVKITWRGKEFIVQPIGLEQGCDEEFWACPVIGGLGPCPMVRFMT